MKIPVSIFKALADETRLRILAVLLTREELCVCDIVDSLQLPQSTISRHLAYLRKTGLVNDRRCGLWMYYSIACEASGFQQGLIEFLRRYLAELPTSPADRGRLQELGTANRCSQ